MNPSSCDVIQLDNEIPSMFLCPITQEVMREPLFTRYGHTFERAALVTWLSNHDNTCPLTRKVLHPNDLVPHYQLKIHIEAWHRVRGIDFNPRRDEYDSSNDDDDYDDDNVVFKTSFLSCRREDLIPSSTSKSSQPTASSSS
jgi:U-box domain